MSPLIPVHVWLPGESDPVLARTFARDIQA